MKTINEKLLIEFMKWDFRRDSKFNGLDSDIMFKKMEEHGLLTYNEHRLIVEPTELYIMLRSKYLDLILSLPIVK